MSCRVASILGAVGLVMGGAAARRTPVFFGPEWDTLHKPVLGRIGVAGDTIWLSGREVDFRAARAVRYYLVRPGTRWTRVDGGPLVVPARAEVTDTTLQLEAGARAHFVWRRDGVETTPPTLTLPDGRAVPLRADVPVKVRAGLVDPEWLSEMPDSDVTFGTASATWLATPHAYWFGLDGGFSEGGGSLGGLLRVDRATGAMVTIAHPYLADVSITSMIAVGDTLFMGTERDGEYGAWGTQGLVRYEPTRDRWLREKTGPGGLPDRLVWSVARAGDSLVVTTGTGVAIRSLGDSVWTSWHFKPQVTDSSVAMALVPLADTAAFADLIARYLWQEHLLRRPADFVRRFARFPSERQLELTRAGRAIDVLADTAFIPELAEAARDTADRWDQARAIELLAAMHHPLATLAARGAADSGAMADVASASRLVVAGDAAMRDSVTRRMQGTLDDFRWALAVVVDARNDRWLPVIARRAAGADTALRNDIYGALALLGTPSATRQLFAFAETDPHARRAVFASRGDTSVAGASMWTRADTSRAARAIVQVLAERGDRSQRAVALAARFRVGPAIPRLIDLLHRRALGPPVPVWDIEAAAEFGGITRALVSLTGRTDAPADADRERFLARADAFWQRWRASAGPALVQAVPSATGAAAVASVRWPAVVAAPLRAPEHRNERVDAFVREREERHRASEKVALAAGIRIRRRAAPAGWASLRP